MRDLTESNEINDRVISWLFVLVLKLYSFNIYSDESYVWKMLDNLDSLEDVDLFFEKILSEFKMKNKDLSRLYKLLQKNIDILSR